MPSPGCPPSGTDGGGQVGQYGGGGLEVHARVGDALPVGERRPRAPVPPPPREGTLPPHPRQGRLPPPRPFPRPGPPPPPAAVGPFPSSRGPPLPSPAAAPPP